MYGITRLFYGVLLSPLSAQMLSVLRPKSCLLSGLHHTSAAFICDIIIKKQFVAKFLAIILDIPDKKIDSSSPVWPNGTSLVIILAEDRYWQGDFAFVIVCSLDMAWSTLQQ